MFSALTLVAIVIYVGLLAIHLRKPDLAERWAERVVAPFASQSGFSEVKRRQLKFIGPPLWCAAPLMIVRAFAGPVEPLPIIDFGIILGILLITFVVAGRRGAFDHD